MTWAVRVERGGLSEAEEAELDAWTAADIRHAGAFARAMAASAYLDRSTALGEDYAPRPPLAWYQRISRRGAISAGIGTALAASLVGVIGIRLWPRGERMTTEKGGMRRVAMADGSTVTLNTATDMTASLEQHARTIAMATGEAIFDVAHNPARPFTVVAGDVHVRAIGTSFIVRLLEAGEVLVTVREGVVGVTRSGTAGQRVAAGGQVLVSNAAAMTVRELSPAALGRVDAWQQGRLDLTDTSLAAAAAEYARYSDYGIVIDDPAVGRMKVAGVYSTSDPRGFAEAAALSLGLKAAAGPDSVRLARA